MKEEDTRERILNAAKEVFSNKGYSGSTTREISLVADVAEVTLFRHFETKNNLFIQVILKFLVNPILKLNISGIKSTEQILQKIIDERTETLRENKDLFFCTIFEAQYNDDIKYMVKSIFLQVHKELMYFIKKEDAKKDEVTSEYMAQVILSTIVGLIIFESLTGSYTFEDSKKLYKTIKTLV